MKKILFALSALALFSCHQLAFGAAMPEFPYITVTGEAEMEVAPNTVTVDFQVMEFHKDAAQAMDTVAERGKAVIELAKAQGLTHEDIESYAVDKQVRRDRQHMGGTMEIIGYEVTQRFRFEIDGLDSYQAIITELLRMPNTSGINASFDVLERESLMRELTAQAGRDARSRAENLASGLDVKIKSVYAISEDQGFENPMAKFGVQEQAFGRVSAADAGPAFDLFAPQTITLNKRISVIFKITP
ncbi:SIMPL domain-containing protein [Gilvimarinus algae]|uniref:SIMPL domain-containing protein n=1 Tax=Gilvimarinus algae TaxID=3058037 RepID=A0ABT8TBD2_9GAMM|nr:SIMPL domain-containing protein [Gilvimarinus sp. SDUM040014]MDO3381261.1 SIMPL domain-containing protein [Gilvimarinus sp. SDUM040014]